ncbi:MAG: hypothetical protein ACR2IF_07330 [Terriglobales bacterium]
MSLDLEKIYSLLPAIYRVRDVELAEQLGGFLDPSEAEELQQLIAIQTPRTARQESRIVELQDKRRRGPLKALFSILSEQVEVLEASLEQAYDDQFIETCQEWVVPYLADLVGARGIYEFPNAPFSMRALVANTISYRQRKGTVSVLEKLARDVTGWDAAVVEFFQVLGVSQYMNHVRPQNLATASIRGADRQLLNTPFDRTAHTAEVRNIESRRGKYNIPNVGIFLWRIRANPITHAPAFRVDDRRYLFDAIGRDTQLYTRPKTLSPDSALSGPLNVPMPISRRRLDSNLADCGAISLNGAPITTIEPSIVLYVDIDPGSPPAALPARACYLADDPSSGGWAHEPDDAIGIDPVLGRIALPSNFPPVSNVRVQYHYGFPANLGGGEYARRLASDAAIFIKVPGDAPTIQQGLELARTRITGSSQSAIVEIQNNDYYFETPCVDVPAGANIELRAHDKVRPVLVLSGDMIVTGREGNDAESSFAMDGLLVAGGNLIVPANNSAGAPNQLRRVHLRHCTWSPAATPAISGSLAHGPTRLHVESADTELCLDHCISGAIEIADEASAILCNSIVDSLAATNVAYAGLDGASAGAPLRIQNTTIIGKIHALYIDLASNVIFVSANAAGDTWGPVVADQVQRGCVRFSYVPDGSLVPRTYRCHPSKDDDPKPRPQFTSLRFGDAAYCQLAPQSGVAITAGADDGSEMGAFHDVYQPQREANLRGSLQEYLRFGVESGTFFVT